MVVDSASSNREEPEGDREIGVAVEQWRARIEPRRDAVLAVLDRFGLGTEVLLAVSKGQPAAAVVAAIDLGFDRFGENYADELQAKAEAVTRLRPDAAPEWHFIGQLQRNKVRRVATTVHLWQSVDRERLITEIATRQPGGRICVQVNLSADLAKAGCRFDEAPDLVAAAQRAGLQVSGLMGVGSHGDDAATKAAFTRLRSLTDDLELEQCSMGMSGDLELALAAGSTMVRLGTALFGPRATQKGTPAN